MKKLYIQIAILILFLPVSSLAQDLYSAEQIDSLQKALDTEIILENRIEILENLIYSNQGSGSKLPLKYAKMLIEEASSSEYAKQVANAKIFIAEDFQKSGNLDSSIV